jgi:hypothetical protein
MKSHTTAKSKDSLIIKFTFIIVFASHLLSYNVTSFDSRWTIPAARSILSEGNIELSEYKNRIEENDYHAVYEHEGKYYNYFPVGVTLIAIPFVFIFDMTIPNAVEAFPFLKKYIEARSRQPVTGYNSVDLYHGVELFIACLIISFASVIIYKISRRKLDAVYSLFITFIFAFCTSAWSIASRGLWQHGPVMLLLAGSLYLLLEGKRNPSLVKYAGLLLAYVFVVRPVNVLSLLLFGIYIFFNFRKQLPAFITFASFILVPFLTLSFIVFENPLPPYYLDQLNILGKSLSNSNFTGALFANTVSPARGLFIFSPVLIFSIYGMYLKFGKSEKDNIDIYIIIIIFLHWIAISTFDNWWAGHSYGPRFFSDMIPYFIYFLIPFFYFFRTLAGARKLILSSVILVFVSVSFFIHLRGANERKVWVEWNQVPVDIDENPSRVWDWSDIQFLR